MATYFDSLKQGVKAEQEFAELAKSKGYKVKPATYNQNYYKHIDLFLIDHMEHEIPIDVKSVKRIRREGEFQDEYIWVNVDTNNSWLYGKSEYIAFQTFTHFILVNRKKLVRLCEEKVDHTKSYYFNPEECVYKVYLRKNRHHTFDVLSLVPIKDIEKISQTKWCRNVD